MSSTFNRILLIKTFSNSPGKLLSRTRLVNCTFLLLLRLQSVFLKGNQNRLLLIDRPTRCQNEKYSYDNLLQSFVFNLKFGFI